VRVLRQVGHEVYATDLNARGCPDSLSRIDFLLEHCAPKGTQAIVTNPPYKLAEQFIEHALDLCPRVIMLLRLQFLESERRRRILDVGTLARIHVFRNRLPMMHRHDWQGPKASSALPFAWYVWDRNHNGPATLDRISWNTCHGAEARAGKPVAGTVP
jgi:hypothetical protein